MPVAAGLVILTAYLPYLRHLLPSLCQLLTFHVIHLLLHTDLKMQFHTTASCFIAYCGLFEFGLASPRNAKDVMRRSSEVSVIRPKVFIIDMVCTFIDLTDIRV